MSGFGQSTFVTPLFDTKTTDTNHILGDLLELENGNFVYLKISRKNYSRTSVSLLDSAGVEIKQSFLKTSSDSAFLESVSRNVTKVLKNKIFVFGGFKTTSSYPYSLGFSMILNDTLGIEHKEIDSAYCLAACYLNDSTFLAIRNVNSKAYLTKYNSTYQIIWQKDIDSLKGTASLKSHNLSPRNLYVSGDRIIIHFNENYNFIGNYYDALLLNFNLSDDFLNYYEYEERTFNFPQNFSNTKYFFATKSHNFWVENYFTIDVLNVHDSLQFQIYSDTLFSETFKNVIELENGNLVFHVSSYDSDSIFCYGYFEKLLFYSPKGKLLKSHIYRLKNTQNFSLSLQEALGNKVLLSASSEDGTGKGLVYLIKLDSLGSASKNYKVFFDTLYLNPPIQVIPDSCGFNNSLIEISDYQNDIILFPNPTKNQINILGFDQKETINKITVTNFWGLPIKLAYSFPIDISQFKAGVYFIIIQTNYRLVKKSLLS